jgi:plastocyanin
MSSPTGDRAIVVIQLLVGFLLVVFGACLVAFANLSDKSGVAVAVIGVGAAVLPSGAAASASARILQGLPSSPTPELLDLQLDSSEVARGNTVAAAVLLSAPAEPGGFTVDLATSDTAFAKCPASVTIPAGDSIAPFTVTAAAAGTVTVTASTSAQKKTRTLTVT